MDGEESMKLNCYKLLFWAKAVEAMSLESVLELLWHDSVSKFNQWVRLYYKLNGHNVAIY